ncbi:MAG: substrate-binding domain-containing protein [Pseudomonadota bacterium]
MSWRTKHPLAGAIALLGLAFGFSGQPALVAASDATGRALIVQSTTSTQNSGLYEAILPKFTADTGIDVRVVAVGTGQALRNAANGDGDVVIVHAKSAEEKFVADGYGVDRRDLMYNDFVLVGPADDPAGLRGAANAAAAFARAAKKSAAFTSRGDNSGTHKKERDLWRAAGIDPSTASGTWYRELGSGMGATLNTTAMMGAYTLTDRATWISFKNKANLTILVEGDPSLFNQYGIIQVNPARHSHVAQKAGKTFVDWMTGPRGQAAIGAYELDGQKLFVPNAVPRGGSAEAQSAETSIDGDPG